MKNVWRYTVDSGSAGGIVIADTEGEAIRKTYEMYNDWDGVNEPMVMVWKAVNDDDYSKDYPDVLETYG